MAGFAELLEAGVLEDQDRKHVAPAAGEPLDPFDVLPEHGAAPAASSGGGQSMLATCAEA